MLEPTSPDSSQNFECSLTLLQQIVHELEEGNLGLEASLARFEEGVRLYRVCHQILEQAEQKIEVLTGFDANGNAQVEPFDASATFDGSDRQSAKPGRRRAASPRTDPPASEKAPPARPEERDGQRLF